MLDVILWIAIFVMIVTVLSMLYTKITGNKPKQPETTEVKVEQPKTTEKPKRKYDYEYRTVRLKEQEYETSFFRFYKEDFNENDDYTLTKKELIEEHEGERIYRYYPLQIPFKLDGTDVYSYTKEEEWRKVGVITEHEAKLVNNNTSWLQLYGGSYKQIYDDEVEIDTRDPFFGFLIKEKVMHDQK